jgi:preprotein translocase subunit SecD
MNFSSSIKNFQLNKLAVKSPIKSLCLSIGSCTLSFLFGCDLVMGKAPTLCEQGGMHLEIEIVPEKGGNPVTAETITKIQKILSTRLTNIGLKDFSVKANGTHFSVDLPGVKDAKEAEKVLGGTAQLEFRVQKPGTEEKFNLVRQQTSLAQVRLETVQNDKNKTPAKIRAAKDQLSKSNREFLNLFTKPVIAGADIENAQAEPRQEPGSWDIALTFNGSGSQKFTELTKDLAGTGRSIGIFLDDQLISSPTVDTQFKATGITGGKAVIAGNFAAKEAESLAIMIRSGNLPNKIQVIESKSIKSGDRCKK